MSQTAEFLCLPGDRLCQLLSEDALVVNSEMDVFCALVNWIDYDRDSRLCQAAQLLQDGVRLHFISPECIVTKVETVDWLFDSVPECQVVTNEAMRSTSSLLYARWLGSVKVMTLDSLASARSWVRLPVGSLSSGYCLVCTGRP